MPFVANSFVDGPAGGTPITAATLNNLEQGLLAADITNPASAAGVQLAAQLAAVSLPSTLDATVAGYVGTSSATRTALIARGSVVNVKDFGALGNKTTDDTAAIQAAVTYAKTLVRNSGTTKQEDGAVVYFPKGMYLISSTILIDMSNITVQGESASSSIIYAPSATFDLIKFDTTVDALYNCGIRSLRLSTPGNTTAGYQLMVMNTIYFFAENLLFNGWFNGLYVTGGGKQMFSRLIFSQETRNPGSSITGPAITLGTNRGYVTDVHFTDIQIMEDITTAGINSVVINGCDGVYFENMHMHGTVFVNPSGNANETVLSSLVFSNCYFDGSRDVCMGFYGNATAAYKDIRINNCYFRAGVVGLRFSTTATISAVNVSNCTFAQNTQNGIEIANHNINGLIVSSCIFFQNNPGNSASYGDLKMNGNNVQVYNCDFEAGGAAGYGINVDAAASYMLISGISFVNSAAGTKINNLGGYTSFKGIIGWVVKANSTAAVGTGVTTSVVTHGMNVTPTLGSIRLTPGASCPAFWVTTITATQFTINFASATTAAFSMGFIIDMEY